MKKFIIVSILLSVFASSQALSQPYYPPTGSIIVRDADGNRHYVNYGPGYINVWEPGKVPTPEPKRQPQPLPGPQHPGQTLIDNVWNNAYGR